MGRKKIQITRIQDERNRQITFSKRKAGLLKKAYELSILCDVEIAVIMITGTNKLYQYASSNMNSILIRYTEFKDPDESKTNADILEDITRREKEKASKDNTSGDDDDEGHTHIPLTPNTQAHYQRIDEEFDQVLRQENSVPPPIMLAASTHVPQAMPVSVPVTSPDLQLNVQHIVSNGSSRPSSASTLSPETPGSKIIKSPSSVGSGSMPPPVGTPTRLQTIRSQTLKLHLPGGGRNYISLPTGKSPTSTPSADENCENSNESNEPQPRPQLKVVIPGQKGFVPKTAPTSPPPVITLQANSSDVTSSTASSTPNHPNTTTVTTTTNNDSLTTPIMSLTTPSLFSSLPPSLSSLPAEFPLGSAVAEGGSVGGGSTSALVAFPISIQPGSGNTPGNNMIIQAQNMGQPFLLTQTPYDKQTTNNNSTSSISTPPTSIGGLRDLEQLKLQYDRIYQQISETLQLHGQNKQQEENDEEVIEKKEESQDTELNDEVTQHVTVTGQKRELDQESNNDTNSDLTSGEHPPKIPHLD